MKFKASDIKLKSPGVQIRDKIIDTYGSIKNFAESIDLYESSINQYLMSKKLGSSTFKIRTTRAFGMDFEDLYMTDEQQIRYFASNVSYHIDLYNKKEDIEVFKKLNKLIFERELMEDYAIVCRCYAYYYYNQGIKDRAYSYIDAAVNTMRGRDYVDRFGLYLSDMIYMKASDLTGQEFKRILAEFEETIKKVKGPLTRGHMYRNMAKAYFVMDNLDMSESYYKKVFIFHEDVKSVSFLYMRLADIEKARKNYEAALTYYKKCESIISAEDEVRFFVYNEYAKYYLIKNKFEKASMYMDRIFEAPGWIVSDHYHSFVYTYMRVKSREGAFDKIRSLLVRLLSNLNDDYIHAIHHLKQFSLGISLFKDERVILNQLNQDLIKHISQKKLDNYSKDIIKQVIGEVSIHLYKLNI